ncbi:MAG: glycosyltransferase, partial [Lachnospiraceae bacterium]|nr:glycosyltransferase [Lachnospiraceae bacterium]
GGGLDAEEMQTRVRDYGIALDIVGEDKKITHYEGREDFVGKVIFTGPEHDRERLRAWNTRADLFLFPSVYDTNGIVVREAAACGLGSVLIAGSCAAEGITHDRNGFIIDESPSAMALQLADLARHPEHMRDVGQKAMDEIYISWDESARMAYRRYEEILGMVQDGTMERRKKQGADYLLGAASNLAKVFNIPYDLYEGMKDNYQELKEDMVDSLKEIKDSMEDGVRQMLGKKENEDIIDDFSENDTDEKQEDHNDTDEG